MKSYVDAFLGTISPEFLKTHTQGLMEKELPQTNKANLEAVDYIKRNTFCKAYVCTICCTVLRQLPFGWNI